MVLIIVVYKATLTMPSLIITHHSKIASADWLQQESAIEYGAKVHLGHRLATKFISAGPDREYIIISGNLEV